MRKLLTTAAAAAAAIAISSSANAAVVITSPSPAIYTPPATGGFLGIVTPSAGATSSTVTPFTDVFSFSIAGSPGSTNAQVGTILLNGIQNINFTSITLDGNPFTLTSAVGAAEQWACCGVGGLSSVLLGVGSHNITLVGNLIGANSGSYSGTLNVQTAPVPEPATWAMMLLGFGATGLMIRRRRRPVLAQLA
ncbi:MAG TPA: FxDxF family PEP-CTERM protein [Sphingomicrobium sp.]|nr:FxDxF family PEP-CTERM protein [Sphingomicrobium sp.]